MKLFSTRLRRDSFLNPIFEQFWSLELLNDVDLKRVILGVSGKIT